MHKSVSPRPGRAAGFLRLLLLLLPPLLLTHVLPHIAHPLFMPPPTLGYTQLKPVAGQWKISVAATRTSDKSVFEPQVCDSEKLSAPCNQPLLNADANDKLQVKLQLKDKQLKTIDNLQPKRVVVRACYTKSSAVDRPWRKAADVIDVSVQGAVVCCCCMNALAWGTSTS